jgi:hypothetical protein
MSGDDDLLPINMFAVFFFLGFALLWMSGPLASNWGSARVKLVVA